jgi:TldD protein
MKTIAKKILEKLNTPDITFADVRITRTDQEQIYFQNGFLRNFNSSMDSLALGIRVLINGCWGFAGTRDLSDASIEKAIAKAKSNAVHGSRFIQTSVKFSSISPTIAETDHQPQINPFLMPLEEKLSNLQSFAIKIKPQGKVVHSYCYGVFFHQDKVYCNTEGTLTRQSFYNTLPVMCVIASDGNHIQTRTWPGHMSGGRGGFELFKEKGFEENTDRIIKEATDLLKAPEVDDERADLIIAGGHLALQLHESVGHATEADRIFGMEISYAGKTFIKPEMIGSLRYGSDIVNIYSDSTDPAGMGYHPVDDEGVPGKRAEIIKNGILADQQTSRDIAHRLGLEPSSNMKASYGDDIPLVRMTNLCIAPQKGSLNELIANTEKGYLVDFTKTWSIDDNRNNFQFTTEIGWKIVDGRIVGIVKEPTYYGITTEFWNSCDWICGPEEWGYHGTFHCGKGEPGQAMQLSHGVAPARFKNTVVKVKL